MSPARSFSAGTRAAPRRPHCAIDRAAWLLGCLTLTCVGGAPEGLAAPQAAPRSGPPQYLTVMPTPGTQVQAAPGSAEYDFGHVSGVSQAPIVHVFLLRNDGGGPLTLDHLQSSCGCTSASLLSPPPAGPAGFAAPVVFTPRQQVQVSVDKYVWVFVKGSASPRSQVEMTGNLAPRPIPLVASGPLPCGLATGEAAVASSFAFGPHGGGKYQCDPSFAN